MSHSDEIKIQACFKLSLIYSKRVKLMLVLNQFFSFQLLKIMNKYDKMSSVVNNE